MFQYYYNSNNHPPAYVYKRIITDLALNKFRCYLDKISWNNVLQCQCPYESFNLFFLYYNVKFQDNFPLRKVYSSNRHEISPYIYLALNRCIKEKIDY